MNGVDFRFIFVKPPFLLDMKGGGGLTCPLITINIINCLTLGQ